jgi:hypothetical protein
VKRGRPALTTPTMTEIHACCIRTAKGCLEWQKGRDRDGYGKITRRTHLSAHLRTHRIVWMLVNGPIPPGLQVLHRCDTPSCCEPAHLFLGTNRDNIADRAAKGRSATGERVATARLTEELVRQMRAIREATGISYAALGRRFGVSDVAARDVISRRTWAGIS